MRFLLFTLASACAAFAADINLVAKFAASFEEGVGVKRVQFTAADAAFAMTLETGTNVERLADGTRFTFQGLRTATCEVRPSPVPRTQPIAPENHRAYLEAARSLAPAGVVFVEKPEVTEQPLAINGWKSHRAEFDYHFAEDSRRTLHRIAVSFITLESGQQIVLITRARATEFAAAHARAESMIRSWHPAQSDTVGN